MATKKAKPVKPAPPLRFDPQPARGKDALAPGHNKDAAGHPVKLVEKPAEVPPGLVHGPGKFGGTV